MKLAYVAESECYALLPQLTQTSQTHRFLTSRAATVTNLAELLKQETRRYESRRGINIPK